MMREYFDMLCSTPLDINIDPGVSKSREIIIAVGKSAGFMYEKYCEKFKEAYNKKALVILPEGMPGPVVSENCEIIYSTHPYITTKSFKAASKLHKIINIEKPDTVTVLLSGGSSALIEEADDKERIMEINKELLLSGLDIVSVNKERIKNSLIKGGKFASLYPDVFFNVLVMSDIPFKNGEQYVGSNPFYRKNLKNTSFIKCADSDTLHDHILSKFRPLKGKRVVSLRMFNGSVDQLSDIIVKHIKDGVDCLVVTGEPSIKVERGITGTGGRMSHLALKMIPFLEDSVSLYALSSDGIDGNSSFSGAVVKGTPHGYDQNTALKALLDFNSATYLDSLGCSVKTGYTGMNLNDFVIVIKD
jgi:glycerate 2-kinase